jgi:hypothetical protein
LIVSVLAVVAFAGCERPLGGGHYNPPLVQLLADPGGWHGKRVLTAGFLSYGLSGPSLYLTSGDAAHGVAVNSIALDFTSEQLADSTLRVRVDNQYVAVTGLFEQLATGDLTLKDVGDIMVFADKSNEKRF